MAESNVAGQGSGPSQKEENPGPSNVAGQGSGPSQKEENPGPSNVAGQRAEPSNLAEDTGEATMAKQEREKLMDILYNSIQDNHFKFMELQLKVLKLEKEDTNMHAELIAISNSVEQYIDTKLEHFEAAVASEGSNQGMKSHIMDDAMKAEKALQEYPNDQQEYMSIAIQQMGNLAKATCMEIKREMDKVETYEDLISNTLELQNKAEKIISLVGQMYRRLSEQMKEVKNELLTEREKYESHKEKLEQEEKEENLAR